MINYSFFLGILVWSLFRLFRNFEFFDFWLSFWKIYLVHNDIKVSLLLQWKMLKSQFFSLFAQVLDFLAQFQENYIKNHCIFYIHGVNYTNLKEKSPVHCILPYRPPSAHPHFIGLFAYKTFKLKMWPYHTYLVFGKM